jgi:hypothetical protein
VDVLIELLAQRCRAAQATALASQDAELRERIAATSYSIVSAKLTRG